MASSSIRKKQYKKLFSLYIMQQICSLCNKTYSNKKCLLQHNRNIHAIYCIEKDRKRDETTNSYSCKYCKKEYKISQSRWYHEKICPEKIKQETMAAEMERIKIENERIKLEAEKQKEEIIRLQKKLLSSKRLDKKTFKAVNKLLIERSLRNSNNNNNNTNSYNTINNNNTFYICSLGKEDLLNVLTTEQKKLILDSRLFSLEKMVEIVHCGEMDQFKNVAITNLKDNYAYRYDESKGYFITVPKNSLFDDIVSMRVTNIEDIYDEMKTTNKINERTKKVIKDFLDKMDDEHTPFYDNDIKYDNFKACKMDKIKIILYNNQEKITHNIATMIKDEKGEPVNTIIL
jgi:hypothetical protein